MKNRIKRIIAILPLIALPFLAGSCTYDEQPPRTTDSSSSYVLPKGEIPSDAEIAQIRALKEEYDNATGNNQKQF